MCLDVHTRTAEREGGGGEEAGRGERDAEREGETENVRGRRKNGESMNCLASSKGIPWNSNTFCFSELILDYHLPYGRLPEGLG